MNTSTAEIRVGDRVVPYALKLTLQRLVMSAGATRDFAPIHHNPDVARATGADRPYANTILLQAVFEVTLRAWMGPQGRLRELEFSMKSFNYAGDTLTCSGAVTGVTASSDHDVVDLDVWIETPRGRSVVGTAKVELPGLASSS